MEDLQATFRTAIGKLAAIGELAGAMKLLKDELLTQCRRSPRNSPRKRLREEGNEEDLVHEEVTEILVREKLQRLKRCPVAN